MTTNTEALRLAREALIFAQQDRECPSTTRQAIAAIDAALSAQPQPAPAEAAQPVAPVRRLIGWRTDDYLNETADKKKADNWAQHYNLLPIFEGDPHTKLTATPTTQPAPEAVPALPADVRAYLVAAADGSMSRNNSQQLAAELLAAAPPQEQA